MPTGHRLSRQYVHVRLIVCVCVRAPFVVFIASCTCLCSLIDHNIFRSLHRTVNALESNLRDCCGINGCSMAYLYHIFINIKKRFRTLIKKPLYRNRAGVEPQCYLNESAHSIRKVLKVGTEFLI